MQRMVVDDLTDGCKTLLNPTKLMDDIYRIWCETTSVAVDGYPYDMYFSNEYKEYVSPKFKFASDTYDWKMGELDGDFEIELPASI